MPAFAADTELSGSHVNNLWGGVHSIMTIRATRFSTWGVQEVEDACCEQLASLPAYRSAVAPVISRVATAYTGVEVPRSVHRVYLQFFLPFWLEHILERNRLDASTAEDRVALILQPEPAPAQAPPSPAPLATTPPPAEPTPWPSWPYPSAVPVFHYPTPETPPPYFLLSPTHGGPAPAPHPPPQHDGSDGSDVEGEPGSDDEGELATFAVDFVPSSSLAHTLQPVPQCGR